MSRTVTPYRRYAMTTDGEVANRANASSLIQRVAGKRASVKMQPQRKLAANRFLEEPSQSAPEIPTVLRNERIARRADVNDSLDAPALSYASLSCLPPCAKTWVAPVSRRYRSAAAPEISMPDKVNVSASESQTMSDPMSLAPRNYSPRSTMDGEALSNELDRLASAEPRKAAPEDSTDQGEVENDAVCVRPDGTWLRKQLGIEQNQAAALSQRQLCGLLAEERVLSIVKAEPHSKALPRRVQSLNRSRLADSNALPPRAQRARLPKV